MPPLPEVLTFTPWQRSRLFERAGGPGPRLTGRLALTLEDAGAGHEAQGEAPFTLLGAADIAGLKPGAIKQTAPAPFARDAETTKLVHVDFWEKDLPWRYTPERERAAPGPPGNTVLRPWLVLLVGTGEEIQVRGGIANVRDSVLGAHDLAQAHLWAHVQFDGQREIGRVLSPRPLEPQREYVAVLVPAFNAEGQPMWRVTGAAVERAFGPKGVLPAFHTWRFWTAEAGDFETLAAALHMPPAGDVGKSTLRYRRRIPADGVDIDARLEVRGAITSLQAEPAPGEALQQVREDLDRLNDALENAIGLPHYGRPWLPNPDELGAGWPHELNDDPRFRGIAGLGLWMGVEGQEALVDAAVRQAGALREAGQRIGQLALGLWAAGRLWDRRFPADAKERLRIMGPIMARMVATDGGIVLNRVTSGSSPLAPALFSGAAQRVVRDRSPHTRHLSGANGGVNRSEALAAANQPAPPPERAPNGLPHLDAIGGAMGLPPLEELLELDEAWVREVLDELFELVRAIGDDYRQQRDHLLQSGATDEIPALQAAFVEILNGELGSRLQDRLAERELPCEGFDILGDIPGDDRRFWVRVLEEESGRRRLMEALGHALRRCMIRRPCEDLIAEAELPSPRTFCGELVGVLPPEPRPEQKPIDLDGLSGLICGTFDPRRPDPPAKVRLCSRLEGIDCTRLVPPEFPIGLDFPTWDLLRKHDKEWLLPGVGSLEKDSITALQTNPTFIDAYMVGINSQFMSEMRWRDLAVARTCTPLRMFWGQVNYATQQRQADVEPLAEWAKAPADPLGALSHQTIKPDDEGNTSGSRLVIAFRSDLFRRYPATLVYLVRPPAGATEAQVDALLKATPQLDKPETIPEAETEQWRKARQFFGPIFAGTITPEITFFAFDVTPSELDRYWLVLDEPPAELRFRNDRPADVTNSATFAKSTLDQPTRVAISGAELERQGINP